MLFHSIFAIFHVDKMGTKFVETVMMSKYEGFCCQTSYGTSANQTVEKVSASLLLCILASFHDDEMGTTLIETMLMSTI